MPRTPAGTTRMPVGTTRMPEAASAVLLNGEPVAPDPQLPLVTGDTLVLR